MIGLMCLKKFMLIKLMNHINALIVITLIFDGYHDLMQKTVSFNVAIFLLKKIVIEFSFSIRLRMRS